jgi:transcriptional regulator with XRE-family HTH domain
MKKIKPVTVRNARELASALGLSPADAIELEIRSDINDKIIAAVKKSGLTHAQVAKAAGTSRTRLTAILNHDRTSVSTDLMLRILAALGYRTRLTFHPSRPAA